MICDNAAPTMLENVMQVNNYKQVHIADLLEVNKPTISGFLKGKRTLRFSTTFKIQNLFFKEDRSFILEMISSYQRIKDYIRPAMEYLSINYELDELKELIDKIRNYDNTEDLCNVYDLVIEYSERNIESEELLKKIKRLSVELSDNSPDLIALLFIIEANIYGINAEYKSLFRLTKEINHYIDKVEDEFVKDSLNGRLFEILCQAELFHNNDVQKSRNIANKIINLNICAKQVSYGYYILGTSYLFLDYDKARENFMSSHNLYVSAGFKKIANSIKQNVYVLENVWEREIDKLPDDISEAEKAHRLIKKGEVNEAISILRGLKETPFRNYYLALATDDYDLQFKSLGQFIKQGDYFFANLPMVSLNSHEVYSTIAKNIYEK